MNEQLTKSVERIRDHPLREIQEQDPEVQVRVRRASLGWVYLYVTTSIFAEQDLADREQQINTILAKLSLKLSRYPFFNWELLTPQEAEETKED